jgi:hypothetical protein
VIWSNKSHSFAKDANQGFFTPCSGIDFNDPKKFLPLRVYRLTEKTVFRLLESFVCLER